MFREYKRYNDKKKGIKIKIKNSHKVLIQKGDDVKSPKLHQFFFHILNFFLNYKNWNS